jgi:hypothetical protein
MEIVIQIETNWGLHKTCDVVVLKEEIGVLGHVIGVDQARLADTVI